MSEKKLIDMFPRTRMSFLRNADFYIEQSRPDLHYISSVVWARKIRSVCIRSMPTELSFGSYRQGFDKTIQGFHIAISDLVEDEKIPFLFSRLIAMTFPYDLHSDPPKYELPQDMSVLAESFYEAFAARFTERVGEKMILVWIRTQADDFSNQHKNRLISA